MKAEKIYIYGKHALSEAARHAPQALKKAFLSDSHRGGALEKALMDQSVPVSPLTAKDEKSVSRDAGHQGAIGVIDPSALITPFEIFIASRKTGSEAGIVFLDGLTDPHNFGAIVRTAAAFGATAVIFPESKQVSLTGAAVKASAGMAFRIPLVSVKSSVSALKELKKKGFSSYALLMNGKKKLGTEEFPPSTVFVFGNEGSGVSKGALSVADETLSIPMHGRAESLNVAASAASVLYEWSRQYPKALS
jgi:predicted rRNA methylase